MIQRIEVRNFQSLHHVTLEFGRFTAIVGPSDVGKSALTRAVRTLTSNRRGAEFISHGERTASISATTERGTVTLTRGKGTTDNTYTVTPNDPSHPLAPQRIFGKLGGETPPEVSAFLGIAAKDPINYAGQSDMPYMLDDSGSEVARILGTLTNASVIFEAARESNRRKLSSAATLRTKADDLEAVKAKVPAYTSIKAQAAALTEAESRIEQAIALQRSIARLTDALDTLALADNAVETWTPLANAVIPDEQPLLDAVAHLTAYRAALIEQNTAAKALEASQANYDAAEAAQAQHEAEYAELIGTISDDLAGWFATVATRFEHEGTTYVTLEEAVRVAALFIEEQAKRS